MIKIYKLAMVVGALVLLSGCAEIETWCLIEETGRVQIRSEQDLSEFNDMIDEAEEMERPVSEDRAACENSSFGEELNDRTCVASEDGNILTITGWRQLLADEWEEKNGYFRLKTIPSVDESQLAGPGQDFLGIEYTETIQVPGDVLWASAGLIGDEVIMINLFSEEYRQGILNFEAVVRGSNATGDVPWEQSGIPEKPVYENDCGKDLDCFIMAAEDCSPAYYSAIEIKGEKGGMCAVYRHVMGDECLFEATDLVAMLQRWQAGQYSSRDWNTCNTKYLIVDDTSRENDDKKELLKDFEKREPVIQEDVFENIEKTKQPAAEMVVYESAGLRLPATGGSAPLLRLWNFLTGIFR